jgi:transposase-like protein
VDQPTKFARLSPEQWQQIIDQQLESGLNQKDFCQSRHISLATFSNWKRKLKNDSPTQLGEPASTNNQDWVAFPTVLPETSSSPAWNMELELPGGVILRMRH